MVTSCSLTQHKEIAQLSELPTTHTIAEALLCWYKHAESTYDMSHILTIILTL